MAASPATDISRSPIWGERLARNLQRLERVTPPAVEGYLTRMIGLTLEAVGCQAAVGDYCDVVTSSGTRVETEVVGFSGDRLYLMPTGDVHGLEPNARVIPRQKAGTVRVGPELLGRIIDGSAQPLDGLGPLLCEDTVRLTGSLINPLARQPISEPLDVGIRSINSLFTVGRGQRIGLFAGSGVGKSVLLGMMARYTRADVIVVGLIGERGREVKEFIEHNLGPEGLARSIVVAAPADVSPLLRLQGAAYATRLAEYFRDQGRHVLLIMDSLTRVAMAQREIALAIGEPPATKGYPPSVFARLPALVERAGNGAPVNGMPAGSITAFYTVLAEGDDQQDPIADAARAILDGHIVLSRELAEAGHYPAIDIEASISRVMTAIIPPEQYVQVRGFKQMLSRYQRNRDLIAVGAYVAGADPRLDEAIARYPALERFLQQDIPVQVDYETAVGQLGTVFGQGDAHA